MLLELHGLTVHLDSPDVPVRDYWRNLFGDWVRDRDGVSADIRLTVHFVKQLPPLPTSDPFFTDYREDWIKGAYSVLEAYRTDSATILHFFDGGLVNIPVAGTTVTAYVTRDTFYNGRLEDITSVSLAPLLRQHKRYLLHAAGAALNGEAVLFVGESGSGKTTTCLNLTLNGWQLISNDVVMLEECEDGIYALSVPDKITVRPKTLELLPQLQQHKIGDQFLDGIQLPDDILPTHQLTNGSYANPARVAAICFPQVETRPNTIWQRQLSVVTLARLLEQSVDCWDSASLQAHTTILTKMSQQATGYALHLGQDLPDQPDRLRQLLS